MFHDRFSWQRAAAMMLRYWYLIQGSWVRLVEIAYWPTLQMMVWGFMTIYLSDAMGWRDQAAGILISAVLLWDVLFRSQLGVALAFLEELYARNLGQLFISPLRPMELIAALLMISLIRTLLGVGIAAILALWFFDYSMLSMGLPLAFFLSQLLVLGWSIGLMVSAALLRYGRGAEELAWAAVVILLPISGIYYPLEVLPAWVQPFSYALPSSYVFEGMRSLLLEGHFDFMLALAALILNGAYIALGSGIFLWSFHISRQRGLLLAQGE